MARKRNTGSDSAVSAGAPAARSKARTSRTKHAAVPVAENVTTATAETTPSAQSAVTVPVETEPVIELAPSYEEIARLAHSFWEARGCQGGSAEEDWIRAENELRSRRSSAAQA